MRHHFRRNPFESIVYAFLWESSEIDWCEENYEVTINIAEFWNTISNALFFVLPPCVMYLFTPYAKHITWTVHIVWLLLLLVGVGSVSFHATLSLFGQLLDELAILWVVMAAFMVWMPSKYLPKACQINRHYYTVGMLTLTGLVSWLSCLLPALNCLFLFLLVVPVVWLLSCELRRCDDARTLWLGGCSFVIFTAGLFCWLVDRYLCDMMRRLRFPYLHSIWHVCVCLSSYQVCVLFAYFAAQSRAPELLPVIRMWPRDDWFMCGVPYVTFRSLPSYTTTATVAKKV